MTIGIQKSSGRRGDSGASFSSAHPRPCDGDEADKQRGDAVRGVVVAATRQVARKNEGREPAGSAKYTDGHDDECHANDGE